ncbi:fatty acid desaturase family protein [Streptomyces sp. P1-3]|uniref:fatty acid desaturase family protein n=1 Tax=Streptomyces sp. P1-3 TaxID=3421658 RepID=UPI003D3661AB
MRFRGSGTPDPGAAGPAETMAPATAEQETAGPPGGGGAELRTALKHLRTEVRGRAFAWKLLLCGLLTAVGIVTVLRPETWCRITGVLLLGCMYAHAAELQHQTLHGLGFRNRRANAAAGIVLGIPMLISFAAYRVTHLRHHRYLGTPLNREFFDYGNQYGADRPRSRRDALLSWAVRFSMIHHYGLFLRNLARSLLGRDFEGETATTSRRIRRDHRIALAVFAGLTALSAALREPVVVVVWVLPLVLVAAPVHAAIELPEHHGCDTLDEDPFANTRTIRSNRFMTWFTNGNNFHVEHHLVPNLPIERLPDAHAVVRDRLRHFHPSYTHYFYKLVRK